MVWATLGIGSNSNARDNIASCLDALLLQFHDMKLSSVFESAAEGAATTASYLNMAVGFETDMPLDELASFTKKLEAKHGRVRSAENSETVALDIDILTYDNKSGVFSGISLPRPQVLTAAYVLWPLSQVAARIKHPVLKTSYAQLWLDFSGDKAGIKPVDFEWHGRRLSAASK